ncbi:hypothetical protein [Nodosilinea sp. FACHB-13]|nr:hypothetical protein [Nodosilinea sp. FACHB-13]MBD2110153.1 hypothetical protein [Nodosilinea sp. FACHB-13]
MGVILGAAGIDMDIITAPTAVIGFLAGLPVSYITFRLTIEHFFIGKF